MKVKLVWENCNFLNGNWSDKAVTSYWLEVEKGEIGNILFYAKFPELILQEVEQHKSTKDNKFYFLVAKNLEFIKSFPSFYPYSGQWNGYSPFLEIPETKISGLDELSTLELWENIMGNCASSRKNREEPSEQGTELQELPTHRQTKGAQRRIGSTQPSSLLPPSLHPPERQTQFAQKPDIERIDQLSKDDNVPEHMRNIMTELYEVGKNTEIDSQGGGAAYASRNFKNGTLDKHEVKYHSHVNDEAERVGNLVHELTHVSVVDKFNTDYVNYTNQSENEVEESNFGSSGERMKNEANRQNQRKVKSADNAICVKLTSLQKLTLEDKNLSKDQKMKVRDKLTYGIQNAHTEFDTVINQISVWLHYWKVTPDKSQLAQKIKEIATQNHQERKSGNRIVEPTDEQPNLQWATQNIT